MNYKGILFDFNGTLFFDSSKHKEAWQIFLPERIGREVTEEEIRKNCLGQNNSEIMHRYFGADISDKEVERLAYEKEALYRSLCLKDTENLHLVKGAEEYFDHLKDLGVPFTIATGSEIENVKFYFETFRIGRWFSLEKMIWDDGKIPGKPAPDFYLRAAEKIGLHASDCVIFEDSAAGVQSALNANAHAVVQLMQGTHNPVYPGVHMTCTDFCDIKAFDAL
jgi:beta-phosphoglucomutase-like phosphatase (HAD superfamily)